MKKLFLIFLCFPMFGFGQDAKSFFSEPFIGDYATLQIKNNPPSIIDGVSMLKGKIILTDSNITIITNKNRFKKIEADTSTYNTYIYDISIVKNVTKISFKLKEKRVDYKTRFSYTDVDGLASFVMESVDEFNNNQSTMTYILR